MAGFDCSGFVIEILQTVGLLPRAFDTTADGLYRKFEKVASAREGRLVFWHGGDGQRMIHVEYCIDSVHSIGASGGGSKTISVKEAIEQNAYIKIRPFRSRKHLAEYFVDPFLRT